MIRAGEISWSDGGVWICLSLAAVSLVAFVVAERTVAHPLLDVSLFRIPTFVGGSVAALAMNGSLFAVFLYLTLYLQDLLGFSPFEVGLRLLLLSGATLVVATVAGRLSEKIPVRFLIGPGLRVVGLALFAMSGINAGTRWTHLIPGLVLAGIGTGMVNPPLASTAVGVVEPQRSGMASGINTTFRQVGIAASIFGAGVGLHRPAAKGHHPRAERVARCRSGAVRCAQRAHLSSHRLGAFFRPRASCRGDPFLIRGRHQ